MISEIEPTVDISSEKQEIHLFEEKTENIINDENKENENKENLIEIPDNKENIEKKDDKVKEDNKEKEEHKTEIDKEVIDIFEIKEPKISNDPITLDKTTTDALFKELNITISKYSLTTNKWKVKYYTLDKKSEWCDMGIGYIFCSKVDDYQKLIMLTYPNGKEEEKFSIDLKKDNKINFHKERGTIITWRQNQNENSALDNTDDSAISFQERQGFLEIYRNILICEGKDPDKEASLLEDDDDDKEIFEVTSENLPNLIREFGKDMGEERMCRFIVYLRENDNGFIKEMGKLMDDEEKKMEGNSGLSSSTDVSVNGNNNLINNSNNKNLNNNINIKLDLNNSDNKIISENKTDDNKEKEAMNCDNNNSIPPEENKENKGGSLKIEDDSNKENLNPNSEKKNIISNNNKPLLNLNNDKTPKTPIEKIHCIYQIFKNLLLSGNETIYQILLDDDCYLITFKALEYELETQEKTSHHCDFFLKKAKFKNPLHITNPEVLEKIKLNMRLIYLKDIALARFVDENTNIVINSLLQYNYEFILKYFVDNPIFIEMILDQIKSLDCLIQKDACQMLYNLITCTKGTPQISIMFKELIMEKGLLEILGNIISDVIKNKIEKIEENENEEEENKMELCENFELLQQYYSEENKEVMETVYETVMDILINILSAIPVKIKDYLKKEDNHLLEQLTTLMLYYDNFSIKFEVSQIYKNLIENDIPKLLATNNYEKSAIAFFQKPFNKLITYLETPMKKNKTQNKTEISTTKQIIIELFISWFSQKSISNNYLCETHKLDKILLTLFTEEDKVINLYSVKLLRAIVDNCNEFNINIILTNEVCEGLEKLFKENKPKNNIIISCMMDFFDMVSKIHDNVLNIFMTYIPEFFYSNGELFENIILRSENKELPKRKLIKYLNPTLTNFDVPFPLEEDKDFDEYYIFDKDDDDEIDENEFLIRKREAPGKEIYKNYIGEKSAEGRGRKIENYLPEEFEEEEDDDEEINMFDEIVEKNDDKAENDKKNKMKKKRPLIGESDESDEDDDIEADDYDDYNEDMEYEEDGFSF